MGTSDYMKVKTERGCEQYLKSYISAPSTCKVLAKLVKDVIFCEKKKELPLSDEVVSQLKKISFAKKVGVIERVHRDETMHK